MRGWYFDPGQRNRGGEGQPDLLGTLHHEHVWGSDGVKVLSQWPENPLEGSITYSAPRKMIEEVLATLKSWLTMQGHGVAQRAAEHDRAPELDRRNLAETEVGHLCVVCSAAGCRRGRQNRGGRRTNPQKGRPASQIRPSSSQAIWGHCQVADRSAVPVRHIRTPPRA